MGKGPASGHDDIGIGYFANFAVLFCMTILATVSLAAVGTTRQQLQALELQARALYLGGTDPRILHATQDLRWINLISEPPYTGWISATFFNDGPNPVFIGINNPDALSKIEVGESLEITMVGAQRRIEVVFYKCSPGEWASVRVVGKY